MRFLPRHSSIIALMVEPCQVENPVQNQDFDFLVSPVSKLSGIRGRDFGRYGNIARRMSFAIGTSRKRREGKYIRSFIFPSKPSIE